ncbi:hypothetical protein [Paenibacillus pini]|uniref:Lipoprotein n=1 Tax=Paenibacillus pini JCM 16418 TaxID=1236976 RepID=W7YJQ8_9BACL|nr:hypothetical protein [Paenibacillus pini]GAF07928.1 hypothetical protein JCM16418_1961 [Paenibacillus pini JCM 16418]
MNFKGKLAVILMMIGSLLAGSYVFALSDTHNEEPDKNKKTMKIEGAQIKINATKLQAKPQEEIIIQMEKVTDQINKVKLIRENMPNPGYGIVMDRIEFTSTKKAIAYYHLVSPDPKMMYPQVISTAKTFFYMDSSIEVNAKETVLPPLLKLPDTNRK